MERIYLASAVIGLKFEVLSRQFRLLRRRATINISVSRLLPS